MLNNDYNKKVTGSEINNISNEYSPSSRPASLKNKFRKDAKGNLILKKKINIKKSKHHINFIDKVNSEKDFATIINIESYKKYNVENEEEIEENNNEIEEENNKLDVEKNVVATNGCCTII